MSLSELAFAGYIYGQVEDYDRSVLEFLASSNSFADLNRADHRLALLKWLNAWVCRQFAKECHDLASNEIRESYDEARTLLSPDA